MHQTQSLKHQHKILVKTMLYSTTNYNFKNRDFVTDGKLNKRNNTTQQSLSVESTSRAAVKLRMNLVELRSSHAYSPAPLTIEKRPARNGFKCILKELK